ncbi:MAG: efflux RND transporter periplasmic adaptor subunit [Gallionella sp.]|nr:efflux RND transporter periplasmic adaptor subunit [Gallionella sp.]
MKKFWIFCFLLPGVVTAHAAGQLDVATAQYREVAQTYSVDGLVEAVHQSTVSAQISGRVKEVNFDTGDHVKKGQVILRIDEREALQALAGSQAQVFQAQANMQNAKAAYERARQLFAQKFISQAALDKAQADYKVALAQAAASESGAGQASLAHGYTAVIAPYSGVVSARLVEVGEMVMPGKPLMTGFDPAEMRVVASVPQSKLADIGVRPDAMVEVHSLNRWIKPVSTIVQPVADARTHSTQVRVYLPKNETGIYPGMFVHTHFVVGKANKLAIPASAVLRRSEVVAVYVVDKKGNVKLRQVRIGDAVADGAVEVLAGLNPGEAVALDPVKAGMAQKTEDRRQKTAEGAGK